MQRIILEIKSQRPGPILSKLKASEFENLLAYSLLFSSSYVLQTEPINTLNLLGDMVDLSMVHAMAVQNIVLGVDRVDIVLDFVDGNAKDIGWT